MPHDPMKAASLLELAERVKTGQLDLLFALRAARAEGIEAAADAISPFIDKARRQKAACRALAEDIEDDDRLMADIYGAEAQMAGRHLTNMQEAHAAIRALLTKESEDA